MSINAQEGPISIEAMPQVRATVALHIGQHVRLAGRASKPLVGVVSGLNIDRERGLMASVLLDEPIVIPPFDPRDREVTIWWQELPAHELQPFDARDALIAELRAAALKARDRIQLDRTALADGHTNHEGLDEDGATGVAEYDAVLAQLAAAIAKATGSSA